MVRELLVTDFGAKFDFWSTLTSPLVHCSAGTSVEAKALFFQAAASRRSLLFLDPSLFPPECESGL